MLLTRLLSLTPPFGRAGRPAAVLTTTRIGRIVTVTVQSFLTPPVWYHWWVDGVYLGVTTIPSRSWIVEPGDQFRVDVVDTTDPAFDPAQNAPPAWPPRETVWWIRSLGPEAVSYRIEQQKVGYGDWQPAGLVAVTPSTWSYSWTSDRLDDLATYAWRIVPVDRLGNDGPPLTLSQRRIVRTPDAPNFAAVFNPALGTVTFTNA